VKVLVPSRMWEWYVAAAFIESLATYSNLRQFTVETIEQVK
jgi:hypothetical protein